MTVSCLVGNPFAIPAADLLRLMRSKGSIEEVETELSSLETLAQAEPTLLSSSEALTLKRDLAIQTILNVGSRSFSHFLNVLERLELLLSRFLALSKLIIMVRFQ